MSIYYQDDTVTVHHGDCIDVLASLPDASVDAVVTDPPYGLDFMGRAWDRYTPGDFQHWCEQWAAECLRVLKPGGHMVAFGGTRTFHRLTAGIEDAGFEIRDVLSWMYGSGFPKSMDVGKAIDKAAGAEREVTGSKLDRPGYHLRAHESSGAAFAAGLSSSTGATRLRASQITAPATAAAQQWDGWGTALKPAWEPIVLARKPLAGTVAGTVLTHGTGALNIDACRVGFKSEADQASAKPGGRATARTGHLAGKAQACISDTTETPSTTAVTRGSSASPSNTSASIAAGTQRTEFTPSQNDQGRFPANVLLDDMAATALDAQTGTLKSGILAAHHQRAAKTGGVLGDYASQPGARGYGDEGGASRFFYSAKADSAERPVVDGVAHPTVKPLALMEWLIRLVTPPGGTVLEPFAGSGTTLEAAQYTGHPVIGIEKGDEYLPLIRHRLERADPRIKVAKAPEVHPDQLDMLDLFA